MEHCWRCDRMVEKVSFDLREKPGTTAFYPPPAQLTKEFVQCCNNCGRDFAVTRAQ